MEYALTTVNQITAMFVIMLFGGILYKKGLVTEEGNKSANNILLYLVTPVIIFNAFQREFDSTLLLGMGVAAVLSFLSIGLSIVAARLFFKGRLSKGKNTALDQFSCIYTNCGFFGIPLVNGLLGSEGVLYVSVYLIAFYLLGWSHGLYLITGKADKNSLREVLRTPLLPAMAVGLLTFTAGIRLPLPVQTGLDFVGELNTPLAMVVAGVSIAQSDIIGMLKNKRIYYTAFIGLLVIPLMVMGVFWFIPGFAMVKLVVLIATACPAGAMGTMLALRFGGDYKYCSQIFAMTTLLSIFTLPVMVILMQMI